MTIKVITPKKTASNRPADSICGFLVDQPFGPRR
jgi:hypothetical protein